ncbi:MAG: phosphoglycolate phosphatase [Pirellulaceae bacterium]|jgi:phosphoglycolate phosphatase
MFVLLFDIDGTLIRSGGAGIAALNQVCEKAFGKTGQKSVPVHGCTDRGIISSLFAAHDIENTQENWDTFQETYLGILPNTLNERPGRVLPGVHDLLDELRPRTDVALGLLTGNTQRAAEIKLNHFGLSGYFEFGGFGEHHSHRDDVARLAYANACNHLDAEVPSERVWVLGDTPADIQCGRAINANVLAVLTGGVDRELLANGNPDLLLDDLSDAREFISKLN